MHDVEMVKLTLKTQGELTSVINHLSEGSRRGSGGRRGQPEEWPRTARRRPVVSGAGLRLAALGPAEHGLVEAEPGPGAASRVRGQVATGGIGGPGGGQRC
jgi:hypothetical protein